MEFVFKDDFTLLPGTLEHNYAYGPWDVSVSHNPPMTAITVERSDDPLRLLSFHTDRNDACEKGFLWTCNPGCFIGMMIPQDLDVIADAALEAKQVLPEVEAFVLALIASKNS